MKAFLIASLLLGVITLSQEEKCGVETSISASMSRDVSVKGPAGYCASHTSASVSKTVGPNKCSMSASVSHKEVVSTAKCFHYAQSSASVSQYVSKGHQSFSASASKSVYNSNALGYCARSVSGSVSAYKSQGRYTVSASLSNNYKAAGAYCKQKAHNSLSYSQTVTGSSQSTSVSDNREAAEAYSCGYAYGKTMASMDQSATPNHADMSGSVKHVTKIRNGCNAQNVMGGGSMSTSMRNSHQSLSTSVSIDIQDTGVWGGNAVHTSASMSQSLDENGLGLSNSCAGLKQRGTYGYRSTQVVK